MPSRRDYLVLFQPTKLKAKFSVVSLHYHYKVHMLSKNIKLDRGSNSNYGGLTSIYSILI